MATQVTIKWENGEELTATTEEWLVALIYALPQNLRNAVCGRMHTQLPFRSGPRNYVLKAEPGRLGLKL